MVVSTQEVSVKTLEVKTLEHYKHTSGKSYRDLGAELGLEHTTVFRATVTPQRTGIMRFLSIAKAVGMPDDEAREQWRQAKIQATTEQITEKAGR